MGERLEIRNAETDLLEEFELLVMQIYEQECPKEWSDDDEALTDVLIMRIKSIRSLYHYMKKKGEK